MKVSCIKIRKYTFFNPNKKCIVYLNFMKVMPNGKKYSDSLRTYVKTTTGNKVKRDNLVK